MKKFIISIEETIVQEFEVEAENSEKAINFAVKAYKNGEFVLSPGEVQDRQLAVISSDNEVTEWLKFL